MDPVDFLEVANHLHQSSIEADRRTSIGRAYYALYNVLVLFLSKQGVYFQQDGKDHERLVYYLTNCRERAADSLGSYVRDLRGKRITADYQMEVLMRQDESVLAYRWALEAIQLFRQLDSPAQNRIVAQVKALAPFR